MRQINETGLELLKKLEGYKSMPYRDTRGVLTVGYGHTGPDVKEGVPWTEAACTEALQSDLQNAYHIDQYLHEDVNDNQYSALVCLVYNVGLTTVKLSNTLKLVNDGQDPDKEWLGFDHVDGKFDQGLLNRRKQELELYHAVG